jgi:hypothetical protein
MKMKNNTPNRRKFLKKLAQTSAVVAGAPAILGTSKSPTYQTIAPRMEGKTEYGANDQINLALIGSGGMGFGDTKTALMVPGTKLVAAADVYDGRLDHVKEVFGNDIPPVIIGNCWKEVI